MKVHEKSVVKFDFTLKMDDKIIERTPEGKTKTILMGHEKGLAPGLEHSLLGREEGKSFTISIENAYGLVNKSKIQIAPKSAFPKTMKLEIGERLYSQDDKGNPVALRITAVDGDTVTVTRTTNIQVKRFFTKLRFIVCETRIRENSSTGTFTGRVG